MGHDDNEHIIDVESSQSAGKNLAKANDSGAINKRGTVAESHIQEKESHRMQNLAREFDPMLPEPEMPQHGLARLYSSMAKNEIEWREYKKQYMLMAEKQAALLKERADHIIAKAKVIHERELEQLREVLSMHNSEVISGLQQSAHDIAQTRLIEITEDYLKHVAKFADFPEEIKQVMHSDATRVWDHARQKVLKYALELSQNPQSDDAEPLVSCAITRDPHQVERLFDCCESASPRPIPWHFYAFVCVVLSLLAVALGASHVHAETRPEALLAALLDTGESIRSFDIHPDETSLVAEVITDDGTALFLLPLVTSGPAIEPRRLTPFDGATHPVFSPDGEHIAFLFNNKLFTMRANGAWKRLIATYPVGVTPPAPSWFSDEHLLLYGVSWPRYDAQTPDGYLHAAVTDLEGQRTWITSFEQPKHPLAAAANPRRARFAFVQDSLLRTVNLEFSDMVIVDTASPEAGVRFSPDGQYIAYHSGETLAVSSLDGTKRWELGPGHSAAWSGSGDVCIFLADGVQGPEAFQVWHRRTGEVLPLAELLAERQELQAALAVLDNQNANIAACLTVAAGEVGSHVPKVRSLDSRLDEVLDDSVLSELVIGEDLRDLHQRMNAARKDVEYLWEGTQILFDRLNAIGATSGFLQRSLTLGTDAGPFIAHLREQLDEIDRAARNVEVEFGETEAELADLTTTIPGKIRDFVAAKEAYIEAQQEERRLARVEAQRAAEERLDFLRVALTFIFGFFLVSYLIYLTFTRIIEPRLQMRRVKKRYAMELEEDLKRVKKTLSSASDDLKKQKQQKVAWQEILNSTQIALNDIFQDTHRLEMERIEKLGDFYKKVTTEIMNLDMADDQKQQLLHSFKALMQEGMQDVKDDSPFQERLRDVYSTLTKN